MGRAVLHRRADHVDRTAPACRDEHCALRRMRAVRPARPRGPKVESLDDPSQAGAAAGAAQRARRSWPPGLRCRPAFESPKQAAHGDLAVTAAMRLAKALKKHPREIAADAGRRAAARARGAALGRGARDRRPRLHQPAPATPQAQQRVVREVLAAGERFGHRPRARRPRDGRVRVGQPDRPAARGPRPQGRARRLRVQPVRRRRAGR